MNNWETVSYIIGVIGATFGFASYVYRPNLKEISNTVKEIADLLRATREEYVKINDCRYKHECLNQELNRLRNHED